MNIYPINETAGSLKKLHRAGAVAIGTLLGLSALQAHGGLIDPGGDASVVLFSGMTTGSGPHFGDNFTLHPGDTLRLNVGGIAPPTAEQFRQAIATGDASVFVRNAQHDAIGAKGFITEAGTLDIVRSGSFKLGLGDQVILLGAAQGIHGSFSSIKNGFMTGSGVLGKIAKLSLGGQMVGGVIYHPEIVVLEGVGIAPSGVASIFNLGVSLGNVQSNSLIRRLEDLRDGSTGFSAAGFALSGRTSGDGAGLAGVTGPEGKSGPSINPPAVEKRWGTFITGIGEYTSLESSSTASGFDLATGGVNLGVDYRACANFAIGLSAGYTRTEADLANDGRLEADGGKLSLYSTLFGGGFYLDTAVTGGLNGYDTHRTALGGRARGSTDGKEIGVLANAGYDWKLGGLSVGPTASYQYNYVGFDGFTEHGSLAPLKFGSQHAESSRTTVGLKASYDARIGGVVVKPEIRVGWQHEYGDTKYAVVSRFADGSAGEFTVEGPHIGRETLMVGVGFAILWSDRVSTYASYDGELGRTNYEANAVTAGIRMGF